MFFTQMAAMLQSSGANAKLNMLMGMTESGQLSLVVIPQADGSKDAQSALTRPLTIVATPQELDEGFVEAFTQYAGARSTLAEQLAAEATILRAAADESAKRASDKLKGKKDAAKTGDKGAGAPAPVDEEEEGEISDLSGAPSVPAQALQSESAPAGGLKLFG